MQINTTDGMKSVTGHAQGNLNTVLGAAGTILGLMNNHSGLFGNANGCGESGDGRFVRKAELDLVQQIEAKDALLAIKESESYTDKKLVEVTTYLDTKLGRLSDKVDANYNRQQDVNAQQMAYNAAANANIDVLKSQVAALTGVTKLFIPSSNVCQTGCGCGCQNQ